MPSNFEQGKPALEKKVSENLRLQDYLLRINNIDISSEEEKQKLSQELLDLVKQANDPTEIILMLSQANSDGMERDSGEFIRDFIIENGVLFMDYIGSLVGRLSDLTISLLLDTAVFEEDANFENPRRAKEFRGEVEKEIILKMETICSEEMNKVSSFESRVLVFSKILHDFRSISTEEKKILNRYVKEKSTDYIFSIFKQGIPDDYELDMGRIEEFDFYNIFETEELLNLELLSYGLSKKLGLKDSFGKESFISRKNGKFDSMRYRSALIGFIFKVLELESFRKGAVKDLRDNFGIVHLYRYPVYVLKKQLEEKDENKPYGVAFFVDYDHNGAFEQDKLQISDLFDQLQNGGYTMRIVEVTSRLGFLKTLMKLNRKYGKQNKISFLWINGHSSGQELVIGGGSVNEISTDNLKAFDFSKIKDFFIQNPNTFFSACSSGVKDGLADVLSGVGGFSTQGPVSASGPSRIEVRWKGSGEPEFDVVYESKGQPVETKKYE